MPDEPTSRLLGEAEVWQHNRALYPGWLIAPARVRRRLWQNTEHWAREYLHHHTQLPPLDNLRVLAELNWRLETALLPIWNELLPAYVRALDTVDPGTVSSAERPVVRRRWLELACGLVRFHREERQVAEFTAWLGRVKAIPDLPPDVSARLCHERCLFALNELDDEAAEDALKDWPEDVTDGYWSVRRAGVIAELGRPAAALPSLDEALRAVRVGLTDSPDHIAALSREGWMLWLGWQFRFAVEAMGGAINAAEEGRAALLRRFRQLERFGADPEGLTEELSALLAQPPPVTEPTVVERPAFAVGSWTRTIKGGAGVGPKLIPAYQYLRMAEEAGLPPSTGSLDVCKGHLKRAAIWLSDHDPVRTQSLLFRLGSNDVIDPYLTRHRVAALPQEAVQSWRAAAQRSITAALPKAGLGFQEETTEAKRGRQRLEAAINIFGRCVIRDTPEQLADAWDTASELYRVETVRMGISADKPLRALFRNLLEGSPREVVSSRFRSLCELPLANESGFRVWDPQGWPDPATDAGLRLSTTNCLPQESSWRPVARRHLELLGATDPHLRQEALWRLHALKVNGVLTTDEVVHASGVFWQSVADTDQLPWEIWGINTAQHALVWPLDRTPSAPERVKRYILNKPLGMIHGGMVSPDGIFRLAIAASGLPTAPTDGRATVTWTVGDLTKLLDNVWRWWEEHGRKQAADAHAGARGWLDDGSSFRRYVARLLDVLRLLVLPRLGRRSAARALTLIAELQATGLPVGAVLPAILLNSPKELRAVTSAIRREFARPEADFHLSALRGIVYWADPPLTASARQRMPAVPKDLLRQVGAAVALRRPESLELAIDGSLNILRRQASKADKNFRDDLVTGLDYLFAEAGYRLRADQLSPLQYDRVPAIRRNCVKLARSLADAGHTEDAVQRWLVAATNDPLPEVRLAAISQDD